MASISHPFPCVPIYLRLFADQNESQSIHTSSWPKVRESYIDLEAERIGEILVDIATTVRRYKSAAKYFLGAEIAVIGVATSDLGLANQLRLSASDIRCITRAQQVIINQSLDTGLEVVSLDGQVAVGLQLFEGQ